MLNDIWQLVNSDKQKQKDKNQPQSYYPETITVQFV